MAKVAQLRLVFLPAVQEGNLEPISLSPDLQQT